MSALQTLKELIPGADDDGVETQTYECQSCFETFDSAKDQDRVECPDCLSADVQPVDQRSIASDV